jgi:hypothetical protein
MTIIENTGIGTDRDGTYLMINKIKMSFYLGCCDKDGYWSWCTKTPNGDRCDRFLDPQGKPIKCEDLPWRLDKC